MRSSSFTPLLLAITLAAMHVGAAAVKQDGDGAALQARKNHPKEHPKHHPHPHPHHHPTTTAPTSTPTGGSTSGQISCTRDTSYPSTGLLNINSIAFDSTDDSAFAYPRLTFGVAPDNPYLSTTSRESTTFSTVDVYECKSTYMGYNKLSNFARGDLSQDRHYGILRVPSMQNQCLHATGQHGDSATFVLQPCSFADDASQVPQFFFYGLRDQGPEVNYLGGRYSEANGDSRGLGYTELDSNYDEAKSDDPLVVLTNSAAVSSNGDGASFFFEQYTL